MPLDTTTYTLSLSSLRLDGRRWNELRRIHAQISTQPSADGSSYLEMGNTKVLCIISGPSEVRRGSSTRTVAGGMGMGIGGGGGGGGGGGVGVVDDENNRANVEVEVNLAGFGASERGMKRRGGGKGDRRISELQTTISSTFASTLLTTLYPRSTISVALHILSLDGALLAACVNATTLALVDAGVPMVDYMVACTAGSMTATATSGGGNPAAGGGVGDDSDPLLDLNGTEELELPFLTVGTLGAGEERVGVLVMESRVPVERVEGMMAVGVDGCKQVREILDAVVRTHGKRLLGSVPG